MKHKTEILGIGITVVIGILLCVMVILALSKGMPGRKETAAAEQTTEVEQTAEADQVAPNNKEGFVSWKDAGLKDHVMEWNDDALKTKMQDITGIYDRDIMLSDVWEITELDLDLYTGQELPISNITALGELSNLSNLDLYGNEIYDIQGLSGLKNLEMLNLTDNHVSDLTPLKDLDKLFYLALSGNEITDVEVLAGLRELTWVELLNNPVKDYSALSFVDQLMVDEEQTDTQPMEASDAHSVWIGIEEVKILQYLNDEKMIAKMRLGDYVIQLVVPRSLENENYVCSYSEDGIPMQSCAYLQFTNGKKDDALCVNYTQWQYLSDYESMKEDVMELLDGAEQYSMSNGKCLYVKEKYAELILSEYDIGVSNVPGKYGVFFDDDNQAVFSIEMYDNDASKREVFEQDMQQMLYRPWDNEVDYVPVGENTVDYDARMKNMYNKCEHILKQPATFLKENYSIEMDSNTILYYGFYDMTDDDIPELLLADEEKGICIAGEKNCIRIPFTDYLMRSDEPDMYYAVDSNTWGTLMKQYYVTQTDDGLLKLNEGQELYCEPVIADDGSQTDRYTLDDEIISEEKYSEMSADIHHKRHQMLDLWRQAFMVPDYEVFCNSSRLLTDEMLTVR